MSNDEDRSKLRYRRRNLKFHLRTAWRRFFNNRLKGSPLRLAAVVVAAALVLWMLHSAIRRLIHATEGEHIVPTQPLSFLVAGFPKCGTTSLLKTLRQHEQVAMDSEEYCQIARPVQQDDINLKRMNRYLLGMKKGVLKERAQPRQGIWSWLGPLSSSLSAHTATSLRSSSASSSSDNLLLGVKCPDSVKNFKAIHRLTQHSPDCKIIIGMRHPLLYLQSFYNYRVMEAHEKKKPYTQTPKMMGQEHIPSLFELYNSTPSPNNNNTFMNWRDVSRNAPRFEIFLSQFAKTDVTVSQFQEWFIDQPFLAIKPNRFKIFLYTMEQMQNPMQSQELRRDLQQFLGLNSEIAQFGHNNKISDTISQYKEVVNICDEHLQPIRREVLEYAKGTVSWMQDFLNSPDVVVSNPAYLIETIHQWTVDPCDALQSGH